jgi:Ca-activated chloride channel homolog
MRVALHILIAALSVSLVFVAMAANHEAPQKQNSNQRPRTVGQGNSNNSQNANTSEEVDEGDVVRVETQLVSVPAVVTDRNGHPIAGLKLDNFTLLEDGQPQRVANFATTETPFEIALLLDTSGSTRDDLGLIRDAAKAFVRALRPGDRVAILAFKNRTVNGTSRAAVDIVCPLTDHREVLSEAIDDLATSNGTPFYDAVGQVGKRIFRDPPREEVRGRRAIVALTDGVDSSSDSTFDDARASLSHAGVASYFIQVSTEDYVEDRLLKDCEDDGRLTLSDKQLERFRKLFVPQLQKEDYQDFCRLGQFERMDISRRLYNLARLEMNEMARASGGKNFSAATLQDARAAFAQVANEIGTQYSLGYYPSNKTRDGQFRKITVQLRGVKDGQVRAREGYYAAKQ